MRILTFNTWQECGPWQERWEWAFAGLKAFEPDILALQEVFSRAWADEIKKRLAFPFLFFPSEPSGLLLLSRFPILGSSCLTMKTQSPTEDYLRYALFCEIEIKNERLAFFNTHLSWKPHEGEIRKKQTAELLDFIRGKAGEKETAVTGDFNAAPETPEIRQMTREGKFTDAFAAAHPGEAGFTWDNRNDYARRAGLSDRRLDYILIRNQKRLLKKLLSCQIVLDQPDAKGIWPSDHFGVLATFED